MSPQLFEAVGVDRVVTLDVHNLAAFENAFRCPTEHLEARPLFVASLRRRGSRGSEVVVVSPDAGGVKRAEAFRAGAWPRRSASRSARAFVEKAPQRAAW